MKIRYDSLARPQRILMFLGYVIFNLCLVFTTNVSFADWGPNETVKFFAGTGETNDGFGFSVSVSGDTAIVGADHDDDNGESSGSAYIFTRNGNTWSEQAKLTPSDGETGGRFGISVSVSGDTAIVGGVRDDVIGDYSGSAYVFTRNGNTWSEQTKLTPSDGESDNAFGCSVSVFGDTAIVGNFLDDTNGEYSGSAYVFTRNGNTWSEQAKLIASDGETIELFGRSVSVSGDIAIVGAFRDDDNGEYSGSAYVFTRNGNAWSEQAKLIASDGEAGDFFGISVSVSGDTAIVGAHLDDDNGDNSGTAYVFAKSENMWSEQVKLVPSGGEADDQFGYSVSISGGTALIGAPGGNDTASAYIFMDYSAGGHAIPTLNQWGGIIMFLLLTGASLRVIRIRIGSDQAN